MNEYQSKKSLPPRLTSENVVNTEDEEALSSALGGTARLVQRKHGSSTGSFSGISEAGSLPPSSPRDNGSPSMSRVGNSPLPLHILSSPTTTLVHPTSPIESPRTEWLNNWGQVSRDVGYPHPTYTNPANSQWSAAMDASAANWYNAQPIRFHDPTPTPMQQHTHQHHQQSHYMSVDVTMANTFPSFGQSSTLSGAMSPYDYPQQQVPPPQNNPQADWQNLFVEMGANYPS